MVASDSGRNRRQAYCSNHSQATGRPQDRVYLEVERVGFTTLKKGVVSLGTGVTGAGIKVEYAIRSGG